MLIFIDCVSVVDYIAQMSDISDMFAYAHVNTVSKTKASDHGMR